MATKRGAGGAPAVFLVAGGRWVPDFVPWPPNGVLSASLALVGPLALVGLLVVRGRQAPELVPWHHAGGPLALVGPLELLGVLMPCGRRVPGLALLFLA